MVNLQIRSLQKSDIPTIAEAFVLIGWNKPASQYESYCKEQEAHKREVLVATQDGLFAGYITVVWESTYPFFWQERIPEIVDFNVLPRFRRRGIGTALMDEAERRIAHSYLKAGIGVGLSADYGPAQILYVKRGYIPDGRGLVKDGHPLSHGDLITVDDGLALYFTKQLNFS